MGNSQQIHSVPQLYRSTSCDILQSMICLFVCLFVCNWSDSGDMVTVKTYFFRLDLAGGGGVVGIPMR